MVSFMYIDTGHNIVNDADRILGIVDPVTFNPRIEFRQLDDPFTSHLETRKGSASDMIAERRYRQG